MFYPSHQFFLASQSIYLVVFDLSKPGYERLSYWMSQLRSSSPIGQFNPILLVGTHSDQVEHEYREQVESELLLRYP